MTLAELERLGPGDWFFDVRDQLREHVYRRAERTFAAGDAARDEIGDADSLGARQQAVRKHFISALGGLPPSDAPLNARVIGVEPGDGCRVERLMYESRPGHHVTANLYVPDGLAGPSAAVLFLCGHHIRAKHEPEYQRVCLTLCRAGLIVLAQDPIGQGERHSYYEPSLGAATIDPCCPDHDHAGAQCLMVGESLARYETHDAMRSIDYLCSRSEVDPRRIGVTGNSGGGTQTCMVMMADPRIAAAAPGTFIMNRETYMRVGGAQDAEQIWRGFTAAGFDHEDVLLMLAPRPVCVLAVTGDFFPIEGTRETVRRCRRVWDALGAPNALEAVEDTTNHWFTPKLARAAADFFARHLLGRPAHLPVDEPSAFEPSRLWCTRSGQVRGEIDGAQFAFEANLARLRCLEEWRRAQPDDERRARATEWLRAKVLMDRATCDLNPRTYHANRWQDLSVEAIVWRSQPDLLGHGMLFRDALRGNADPPVTLAVWDGGTTALRAHIEWIAEQCRGGRAVFVLDPSGVGALAPRPILATADLEFYGTIHKLATDLIWIDDDLVSLRAHDVLRSLAVLAEIPGVDAGAVDVRCEGRCGIYGRLAALLRSPEVCVECGPGPRTWADWVSARLYDSHDVYSVVLPGALRLFDLDDVDRWAGATHVA